MSTTIKGQGAPTELQKKDLRDTFGAAGFTTDAKGNAVISGPGSGNTVTPLPTNVNSAGVITLPDKAERALYGANTGESRRTFAGDFATGTVVADYATGVTATNAAVVVNDATVAGPAQVMGVRLVQMNHHATNSAVDVVVNVPKATFTNICFEAYNPGTTRQVMTLYFGEAGAFTKYISLTFAVQPGLRVYSFNRKNFVPSGGFVWTDGVALTIMRIKEQTEAQGTAAAFYYPSITANPSLLGPIKMVKGTRATVMFHTDDGWLINIQQGNLGVSLLDLFKAADVQPTLNITTELIGTSGKLTWDNVRSLRDEGWVPVQQGDINAVGDATNPQQGARMWRFFDPSKVGDLRFASTNTLEADAAKVTAKIYADFERAKNRMWDEGCRYGINHLSINQGAYDDRVEAALDSLGYKSVRGVVTPSNATGQKAVSVALRNTNSKRLIATTGGTYLNIPRGDTINLGGALSLESGVTFGDGSAFDPKDYIDEAIQCGGIISFYTHQLLNQGVVDLLNATMAYAKQQQTAGLLSISNQPHLLGA